MRRGGNPAESDSYEYVRYCEICGSEDTCEDPLPPCCGPDDGEDVHPDEPEVGFDGCHHGLGFDEDCEDCNEEEES